MNEWMARAAPGGRDPRQPLRVRGPDAVNKRIERAVLLAMNRMTWDDVPSRLSSGPDPAWPPCSQPPREHVASFTHPPDAAQRCHRFRSLRSVANSIQTCLACRLHPRMAFRAVRGLYVAFIVPVHPPPQVSWVTCRAATCSTPALPISTWIAVLPPSCCLRRPPGVAVS
jgi:hypothetical protein